MLPSAVEAPFQASSAASDELVIHLHLLERLEVILSAIARSGPQRVTKQQLNAIDPLIGRVS